MPNISSLTSIPNEDELYAALEKMEAAEVVSITILRKRSQHQPLRNIVSGLWFAILYRAVEQHTSADNRTRMVSRCRAIGDLTACLRAGNEISSRHNNTSKLISKRMRSGLASWSTMSQEPGLLAIVNFSNPPSKKKLHALLFGLEDDELRCSACRYRTIIHRILRFVERTLRRKESLHHYLANAIRDVNDLINCDTHRKADDVEDADVGLLSQHPPFQVPLRSTNDHMVLGSYYSRGGISLEATFNKSTFPRYTVQYDSPIFICVQSGDVYRARALLQQGVASIFDVDPYNLGLLYYASYYCWRYCGAIKAMQMCGMLIQMGADMNMLDEIGNTPVHTMTDSALMERSADLKATALITVGLFCDMSSQELIEGHRSSRKLAVLHETLLGINPENSSLQEHLQFLQRFGLLAELIDQPDSHGRSALAWAVEYGMADAVLTLLSFGASACQYRRSSRSHIPLLHLVIAGPSPPFTSDFFQVVKILLATDIDINARDNEGWSAWHVAASWRSYDILREIMRTHGACVELEAQTNDGASAYDLSQDEDFYRKLIPSWSEW